MLKMLNNFPNINGIVFKAAGGATLQSATADILKVCHILECMPEDLNAMIEHNQRLYRIRVVIDEIKSADIKVVEGKEGPRY